MTCPACGRTLHQVTAGGKKVDVCIDGCAGLWFDAGELKMFDEPSEGAGQSLLDFLPKADVRVDPSQRRRCPHCEDSVMMRHFSSVRRSVVLDECPTCGAIWLDPGELRAIRSEYPSEQARREAAREFYQEVFGDRLDWLRKEREERVARFRKIRNLLMFVWPFGDGSDESVEPDGSNQKGRHA